MPVMYTMLVVILRREESRFIQVEVIGALEGSTENTKGRATKDDFCNLVHRNRTEE